MQPEVAPTDGDGLRARIGADWPHVTGGVRRALRAWEDPARQALARRALAGAAPTLAEAVAAVVATMPADKARRALHAIDRLCAAEATTPDRLPAAAPALEPLLTRATCETFGVGSLKSLRNAIGLVRGARRRDRTPAQACAIGARDPAPARDQRGAGRARSDDA